MGRDLVERGGRGGSCEQQTKRLSDFSDGLGPGKHPWGDHVPDEGREMVKCC